ncbi:MAG TPA: TonB-dependent receptor [Amphiplicatus sp.]|nr:TonB-dependent receptor [Amphiplicatus sp.]
MRGEYSWRDLQYFTPVNAFPEAQGSYGLVNAAIGYMSPDEHWQAIIFGRNLADEEYITSSGSFTARPAGHVGEPRTWGVRLSYTY